jgi:hypothetical protein
MIAEVTAILKTRAPCPVHRDKHCDDAGPRADD